MSGGQGAPRTSAVAACVSSSTMVGWLLAGIIALALVQRWTAVVGAHPVDLNVYLAGGEAVRHGQDLYAQSVPNGRGGFLQFTYPPFAALAFALLGLTGTAAPYIAAALSLIAYVLVVRVCSGALALGVPATLLVAAAGLAAEPVQRTLLFGQVNLVLLALVVVDVLVVRGRWRGVLVGVAAGIKLTPLVVVAWFLVKRDYRAAATTVLATVATVVVGWLLLPHDSRRFWFSALGATSRFGPEARLWGNQSVGAVVDRATQLHQIPEVAVGTMTAGASIAVMTLALGAAVRLVRKDRELAALCAVALGGLLVSPVSWTHHYVWVVPVVCVLVQQRSWALTALTAVLFFLPPMWALTGRGDLQLGYSPGELLLSAAWVLWAVVVLAAWALRPRAGGPDTRSRSARPRPESEVRPVDRVGV